MEQSRQATTGLAYRPDTNGRTHCRFHPFDTNRQEFIDRSFIVSALIRPVKDAIADAHPPARVRDKACDFWIHTTVVAAGYLCFVMLLRRPVRLLRRVSQNFDIGSLELTLSAFN